MRRLSSEPLTLGYIARLQRSPLPIISCDASGRSFVIVSVREFPVAKLFAFHNARGSNNVWHSAPSSTDRDSCYPYTLTPLQLRLLLSLATSQRATRLNVVLYQLVVISYYYCYFSSHKNQLQVIQPDSHPLPFSPISLFRFIPWPLRTCTCGIYTRSICSVPSLIGNRFPLSVNRFLLLTLRWIFNYSQIYGSSNASQCVRVLTFDSLQGCTTCLKYLKSLLRVGYKIAE